MKEQIKTVEYNGKKIEAIDMSADAVKAAEMIEFEQWKAEKIAKEKEKYLQEQRKQYESLVDATIDEVIGPMRELSLSLSKKKQWVYDTFASVLDLKQEVYPTKMENNTHTFTHKDGTKRIKIGYRTIDNYRDTVDVGIAMVKEYMASLGKNDESKALIKTIESLLSKDQKGNLKPSKVWHLEKLSEELNSKELKEGIKIIRDSYQPETSKQFIQIEVKDDKNEWKSVPLGITEA